MNFRNEARLETGTTNRTCPSCRVRLTAVHIYADPGHMELDQCQRCHGIFFDLRELETVVRAPKNGGSSPVASSQLESLRGHGSIAESAADDGNRLCPECQKPMHRRKYRRGSKIYIDSCPQHGIWLDAGELHQILRWTEDRKRADQKKREARSQGQSSTTTTVGDALSSAFDIFDILDVLTDFIFHW